MAMWLYQLSEDHWSRRDYRVDIWEGERWQWGINQIRPGDKAPESGDTVVFFYAKKECDEPGFYGWAVILRWIKEDGGSTIYFRPVSPSDRLKMSPWGDPSAMTLADQVRGKMPRATLYLVDEELAVKIASGIKSWSVGGDRD
jgi:hypothetical protein